MAEKFTSIILQYFSFHYYFKIVKAKLQQYNQVFIALYMKMFLCIMESCKGKHFVHCIICDSGLKISHGGRSNMKEHFNMTKHIESLCIRNYIIFFNECIFNVTCFETYLKNI